MTRRLALSALGLYPLAFRRRYGQEMRELMKDSPPRPADVADILRGALAAHLRPSAATAGLVSPAERIRLSAGGVLTCWILFAAAGFGFYKTTEDAPFSAAGNAHPTLGDSHLVVQVLAVLASLAVLVGALPLIIAALTAARSERQLPQLVLRPAAAILLFAVLTAILVAVAHAEHGRSAGPAGRGAFIAWELAALACAAVCVASARRALFAVSVERWRLLAALSSCAVLTGAMVAMALATAAYAIALPLDASALAGSSNGPLQLLTVGASLAAQVVAMAAAGALSMLASARGWRAARDLEHATGR
jgi:hypothetical protein